MQTDRTAAIVALAAARHAHNEAASAHNAAASPASYAAYIVALEAAIQASATAGIPIWWDGDDTPDLRDDDAPEDAHHGEYEVRAACLRWADIG